MSVCWKVYPENKQVSLKNIKTCSITETAVWELSMHIICIRYCLSYCERRNFLKVRTLNQWNSLPPTVPSLGDFQK